VPGHGRIVFRATDDERPRIGSGKLQKARDIGHTVLAIGIDLNNVGVARLSGVADTAEHGASLAPINRVSNQGDSVWRATG
jgi:hypothetical protein